jgi:hypothetical protein
LEIPLANNWLFTLRPSYVFGENDIRTIESSFQQSMEIFKVEIGVGYKF